MIILEATYKKTLGLPNYSSHSFTVSVRAEVPSLRRVETETTRLYRILQGSVDKEIQQPGFLPDASRYGMIVDITSVENGAAVHVNGAAGAAPDQAPAVVGTGSSAGSEKQQALIERLAKEQQFTAVDLDGIADRLFKLPLARLNRKQTSEFISELLALAGPPRFRNGAQRPAAVSTESR